MQQYREAQSKHAFALATPLINPDTGSPVVAIGYPIEVGGVVVGVVTGHITLGVLSSFLDSHRASCWELLAAAIRNSPPIKWRRESGGAGQHSRRSEGLSAPSHR
jgi:hypothetical protein